MYEEALNTGPRVVESTRISPMVNAVLAKVELNTENYYTFVGVLQEIIGAEDLVQYIQGDSSFDNPVDLEKDKRFFEEAMKDGYINASSMKILFTGAGGVGKTHAVCFLRGVSPPKCRTSTGCVEKVVTLQVDASNNDKWEEIDIEKRRKTIAEGTCAAKENARLHHQHTPNTFPSPLKLPKVQSQSKTEPKPEPEPVTLEMEPDLLKSIHEVRLSGQAGGELRKIKRVYVVDTGGQPPFLELLSAFVKGASACAFVCKLSENLNHHPDVDYWQEDVKVATYYRHPLSNRQILEQSIHTARVSKESPLLFVIGTHRDEQHRTDETLEVKNKILCDIMNQSGCDFLYNPKGGNKSVVFDVNTKKPEQIDESTALRLRKEIAIKMPESIKIPLRYYGLELELEHLATTKPVIDMKECVRIGDKLNFDEAGLKAALRFLHNLNIVLYYPEVKEVGEMVFCNPLVVIKIVTEVVKHIYRIKQKQVVGTAVNTWQTSCDKGLLTIDQLKTTDEFRGFFEPSVFTPESLFKVLEHLLIAATVDEKDQEFFLPCLLDESTENVEPSINHSTLAFQFHKDEKPVYVPNGLFSALVAYLLSARNCDSKWTIHVSNICDSKRYKNNIRFRRSSSPHAFITLVNYHTNFKVYAECQSNHELPLIRSTIIRGLNEAKKVRNFDHVAYSEAVACKCLIAEENPHFAIIDVNEKKWCCPDSAIGELLGPTELIWYETDGGQDNRPGVIEPPVPPDPKGTATLGVQLEPDTQRSMAEGMNAVVSHHEEDEQGMPCQSESGQGYSQDSQPGVPADTNETIPLVLKSGTQEPNVDTVSLPMESVTQQSEFNGMVSADDKLAKPIFVAVSQQKQTSLTIQWKHGIGAPPIRYVVKHKVRASNSDYSEDGATAILVDTETTEYKAIIEGLSRGMEYDIKVVAEGENGNKEECDYNGPSAKTKTSIKDHPFKLCTLVVAIVVAIVIILGFIIGLPTGLGLR